MDLSKIERENYGILVNVIGIISNFTLFVFKFVMGTISSSISITADALNNLFDAGAFLINMVSFKISKKPADKKYPFGYGRVEYVSGFIIAFFIVITGIEFGKESIQRIFKPETVLFNWITLVILTVSIFIKAAIGMFNVKAGRKINSEAVKALALESLSDAFVTTVILISYLINHFFKLQVDGYSGAIASLLIIYSGAKMVIQTLKPLLGHSSDPKISDEIKKILLKNKNIIDIHDLMLHEYGPNCFFASVHVVVPSNKNLVELSNELLSSEQAIKNLMNISINIHPDPIIQ